MHREERVPADERDRERPAAGEAAGEERRGERRAGGERLVRPGRDAVGVARDDRERLRRDREHRPVDGRRVEPGAAHVRERRVRRERPPARRSTGSRRRGSRSSRTTSTSRRRSRAAAARRAARAGSRRRARSRRASRAPRGGSRGAPADRPRTPRAGGRGRAGRCRRRCRRSAARAASRAARRGRRRRRRARGRPRPPLPRAARLTAGVVRLRGGAVLGVGVVGLGRVASVVGRRRSSVVSVVVGAT